MLKNRIILTFIFILIISNILVYQKAAKYDFINRDDLLYIQDNPVIKSFSAENIKSILTEFHISNYQPVVHFTYAIEYSIFGENPHAYHTINILFHILNSILILLLIYYITGNMWISFIIAMIFSVHPLQVESVVWVSELKGLMSTFFSLLCFFSYIRFSQEDKKKYYTLSLVLFILALLSKPVAVTLPAILLLFDYYLDRISKKRLIALIPFFLISGLFSILLLFAQSSRVEIGTHLRLSFVSNIFHTIHTIGFYIGKLIVPINLSVDYIYPSSFSYSSKEFLISLIVIITGVVYLINFKRIKRSINFGVLFFIITLLPMLRFVPIGTTFAADRYMYLPMIGFFLALAELLKHATLNRELMQKVCVILSSVFILVLSTFSYSRCDVWEDSFTYWIDAFENYSDPFFAASVLKKGFYVIVPGLGDHYYRKGDYNKAREFYGYALDYNRVKDTVMSQGMSQTGFDKYFPLEKYVAAKKDIMMSVGYSYFYENNIMMAKEYFTRVTNEYPDYADGHMVLGNINSMQSNDESAAMNFQTSIRLDPTNHQAHYNYALLLERGGKRAEAIEHYRLADRYKKDWNLPKKALKRLGATK